jgi:murein DD-endopeptidase MepM/ murein hydrolase activator NlpD
MPEQLKKRKKIFRKLKHTYRLVFFNDSTFEEVWHLRFTLINILSLSGTIFILLVGGSMALVMYTPMREMIPGYPTESMRREVVANVMRLDSLENEMNLRDKYFNTINAVISGQIPETTEPKANENTDANYNNIMFTRSEQDSLLRKQVEEEEQFNFVLKTQPVSEELSISEIHFFKPIDGIITSKFNMTTNHFGIDIVVKPNEVVKSILEGTVIMASWTVETGYVIQVQHSANILSVYKHNANLLKKAGDRVKAGDAVAIVGNSGELTTGPHLHFEIWQNGKAVNPEDYIVF